MCLNAGMKMMLNMYLTSKNIDNFVNLLIKAGYAELTNNKGWRTKRANRLWRYEVIYGNTSNRSNKDLRTSNHRSQEEEQDKRQYVHDVCCEDERWKVD